jgi:hypothetical protein
MSHYRTSGDLGDSFLPARFQTGKETAADLVARGAVKNVVDDGSINFLGIMGQAFQHCLGGTALSSRVWILFGEMLLNKFEERLLRIRLSRCSLLLSSHGGQDRKTSSCDSSRLLKCLSKTLYRRAESFPRRTARNTAAPLNFLPRIAFQPTEDDILRDFITASKGLR